MKSAVVIFNFVRDDQKFENVFEIIYYHEKNYYVSNIVSPEVATGGVQ